MFNKVIKIFLAVFYLLSVNVPIIYYLEHQINFDYIVKYICEQKDEEENLCLGNCYLKKKLNKAESTDKQSESRRIEIPDNTISPHYNHTNQTVLDLIENRRNYFLANLKNSNQTFIKPTTLPPELLLV